MSSPPSTPHKQIKRDSASANGLLTPPISALKKRRLFAEDTSSLSLESPTKKRVQVPQLPITPRKELNSVAPSPQKLVFGKDSVYSKTKALLQRSAGIFAEEESGCLPTRRAQYDDIVKFIDSNVSAHTSSSLYITGPPGTGKTAQVDSVIKNCFLPVVLPSFKNKCKEFKVNRLNPSLKNQSYFQLSNGRVENVAITTINCIALSHPSVIFHKIFDSFCSNANTNLDHNTSVKTVADLQEFMETHSPQTTFIVVLDELDKLLGGGTADTQVTKIIFELFLLARLPTVNFLMIGIANSLDLKERFLTRLNLRQDLLPKTILFDPYSAEEMFQIVMHRLSLLDEAKSVFNPIAIKFAAKKCSGNTGDVRKVFDVLRSSIEIVELESVKKMKMEQTEQFQPIRVGMPHVAKVFAQITSSASTKSIINKLNLQQKIILCTLVHRENTDVFQSYCSIDDAYDYYCKFVAKRDALKPLKRNEFYEISNALETCGVVTVSQGKVPGKTKQVVKMIKTNIDEKEFEEEVGKMEILKRFL
ncbi:AAA family ATPase CDC6 KNAG_0C02200 [Huiozyma naganishii CBS 8797]|uniref:Cell division control protein n=1 Tax=Huiozyma naganishii (strain ATCC MYA-139 / BCRC 22969 / CBS 8797 / KCTC 17520 / NBRC 10181 / NCYC 3082 / Yp74L-3) TaxID=1071383 RepID=J7S5R3_HUIN7|nr:hypothetical protein KNAG_0C02200 [Kazachstania naganishii CBS 8797]CCK69331.1 hypothetical protein KNAG_0C02200 [Kazachstania naganishii CBS 8797]